MHSSPLMLEDRMAPQLKAGVHEVGHEESNNGWFMLHFFTRWLVTWVHLFCQNSLSCTLWIVLLRVITQ